MDPSYRNPYTQQWNIGYAHQLNSYSVLEVDFVHVLALFFFFKQKTAYDITYGDWSSDVCSSDLQGFAWQDGIPEVNVLPGEALLKAGEREHRSEERRVGKECRRLCRCRWSPDHLKKKRTAVRKHGYRWLATRIYQDFLTGQCNLSCARWCEITRYPFCWIVFFFKQKTAYEITYGDWSSDVCSSDLCSSPTARRRRWPRNRRSSPSARSEERRVGKECRRLCRSRWWPDPY